MKVAIVVCALLATAFGRIMSPGEWEQALLSNGIPADQVPTWQCIAQWESSYNTAAHNPTTGDHGIVQISEIYWCSPPGQGCGVSCDAMRNDDVNDDIQCAIRIYNEFQAMTGNGFEAWVAYQNHCR